MVLILSLVIASTPAVHVENVKVDGNIKEVEAVDLDGDGKLELVAAVVRGKGATAVRELAIFWNQGGSYTPKPGLTLPIENDFCAFDFAPLDSGKASSLIEITPTGLRARDFTGRQASAWRTIVSQSTLFPRAPHEQLPRVRVAQTLKVGAPPILLVPGLNALTVFARSAETFVKVSEIPLDVDVTVTPGPRINASASSGLGHVGLRVSAPSIELVDANADGRKDLFVLQNDALRVFLQDPEGHFAPTPVFEHLFKVYTDAEEKEGKARDLKVQFTDVDGDGMADAVISKTVSAGITSSTTTVYLFRATATGYPATATQTLTTDGASIAGLVLQDISGDGHPDLIIPSVKIGVIAIIRMLTSNKLNVGFLLHPWVVAEKRFALKPTAERTLVFDLDLAGKTEDVQAIDMTGDFDGDGQSDLIFGVSEQNVSVFHGSTKTDSLFQGDPIAEIDVRAFGEALPVDLDGQKRADIVLWYSGTPDHKNEIAIVHNRVK